MKVLVTALLIFAVLFSWLAAVAFLRLQTPLERLHIASLINVPVLGLLTAAGLVSQGITPQTAKCALLWLFSLVSGALLAHATARALQVRGGEAR